MNIRFPATWRLSATGRIRGLWTTLLMLAASCGCAAGEPYHQGQIPRILTKTWTSRDGLPSNEVTAITQTADGYLWVGTSAGLCRFDGVKFTLVRTTHEALGARVTKLVTRGDELWMALDRAEENVVRLTSGGTAWIHPQEHQRPLLDLMRSAEGKIYGLTERGIERFDAQNEPPIPYPKEMQCFSEANHHTALRGADSVNLLELQDGNFLLVTPCGVWLRQENQWTSWELGPQDSKLCPPAMVDCEQRVWISSGNRCLWRQTAEGWAEYHFGEWINSSLLAISQPRTGDPLMSATAGGIFMPIDLPMFKASRDFLAKNPEIFTPEYLTVLNLHDFTEETVVNTIYHDAEENVWLGLRDHGLTRICQYHPTFLPFYHEKCPAPSSFVAKPPKIVAVELGEQNEVLTLGEQTGGIINCKFLAQARTMEGWTWIGIPGELNLPAIALPNSIKPETSEILAMWKESPQTILTACANGGVYRVGKETATKVLDIKPDVATSIVGTKDGTIWLGLASKGIVRVEGGKCKVHTQSYGLGNTRVGTLYVDTDGELWAGLINGGLALWTGGEFKRLGPKEGLLEDTVTQMADDGKGCLWIQGRNGIYGVMKRQIKDLFAAKLATVRPFSMEMSTVPSTGEWAVSRRDNRVLFGTGHGMLMFQGPDFTSQQMHPSVALEGVKVNGLIHNSGDSMADTLSVAPNPDLIEIEYTGLKTPSNETLAFRYRLNGWDQDWTEVGTRRMAKYSNLPPGNYHFEVQASGPFGEWSKTNRRLAINIQAEVWQNWWFKWGFGAATLAAIWRRVSSMQRRQRENQEEERRQAMEKERSRIARDLHDDLGGTLTEVAMLSELAQAQMGDQEILQAKLQQIAKSAAQGVQALDEIIWETDPAHDQIESTLEYLVTTAQRMADAAGMNFQTNYTDSAGTIPLSIEKRHHLFLAVRESVNNAVKHSKGTELCLWISLTESSLLVETEDNGRGFDLHEKGISGADGVVNMRNRMHKIGGFFKMSSQPGEGTKVRFELPIC